MAESAGRAARREIEKTRRAFLAHARRSIAGAHDDELHATRIAAKRLRYTIEFFAALLGPQRTTALGLLVVLQDRLGEIADAEAFTRFYRELLDGLPKRDPRRTGVSARITACAAQRREAIDAVRALWRGGAYPPYPDMLAASISASLASSLSSNGP
jgi:CHAD domain-containing protein